MKKKILTICLIGIVAFLILKNKKSKTDQNKAVDDTVDNGGKSGIGGTGVTDQRQAAEMKDKWIVSRQKIYAMVNGACRFFDNPVSKTNLADIEQVQTLTADNEKREFLNIFESKPRYAYSSYAIRRQYDTFIKCLDVYGGYVNIYAGHQNKKNVIKNLRKMFANVPNGTVNDYGVII